MMMVGNLARCPLHVGKLVGGLRVISMQCSGIRRKNVAPTRAKSSATQHTSSEEINSQALSEGSSQHPKSRSLKGVPKVPFSS